MKWQSVEKYSTTPVPRIHHSAVFHKPSNSMIIFGGYSFGSQLNSLSIYNLSSQRWKTYTPKTDQIWPEARCSHSAVVYQDSMVMFGGEVGNKLQNDVWRLDLKTLEWKKMDTKYGKFLRKNHSSVLYKNIMIVLGGFDGSKFVNDLCCLSLETYEWYYESKKAIHPIVNHKSALYKDDLFICTYPKILMQRYNFVSRRWNTVELDGFEIGFSATSPSLMVVGNRMILCTGVQDVDKHFSVWASSVEYVNHLKFEKQKVSGEFPLRENYSTIVNGGSVIFFGGHDSKTYTNDLYELVVEGSGLLRENLVSFVEILYNGICADVTFLCDGEMIPAHQCLVMQSSVLAQRIQAANGNDVKINDISAEIFKKVLLFLYSEKVQLYDLDEYIQLFKAAEILQINSLLHTCYSLFFDFVKAENAIYTIKYASEIEAKGLCSLCTQFIVSNLISPERWTEIPQFTTVKIQPPQEKTTLREYIKQLYITAKMHDIILISTDEKRIKAHRAVLANASDYFASLFKGDFSESQQNELHIQLNFKQMDNFVKAIYSSNQVLPKKEEELMELIQISDEYMVVEVKYAATEKLRSMITPSNVQSILQFCFDMDIHGTLRKQCWNVIRSKKNLYEKIIENQAKQITSLLLQRQKDLEQIEALKRELNKTST